MIRYSVFAHLGGTGLSAAPEFQGLLWQVSRLLHTASTEGGDSVIFPLSNVFGNPDNPHSQHRSPPFSDRSICNLHMHVVYNCKIHSNPTNGRIKTQYALDARVYGGSAYFQYISASRVFNGELGAKAPYACDVPVSDAKFIRQRPEIQKATPHESQMVWTRPSNTL